MGVGNIANTGMRAAMTNMEYISNNISNANTTAYKKVTANFSDVYSSGTQSTQVAGLGVQLASATQDFTTGGVELTDGSLDLSISNNDFFIMNNSSTGQTSYTRAGSFSLDPNGYIVVGNQQLMGYPAANGVILASANLVPLQIIDSANPARASANINQVINLNANSAIPTSTFTSADPSSYNYRTDTTIYDSLGNAFPLSMYFVKSGENAWTTNVEVNGAIVSVGTTSFDSSGNVSGTTGLTNINFNPASGAVSPQEFNITLTGTTQYAGDSKTNGVTQDGYQSGVPTGYVVNTDGTLEINYSNGQNILVGQIALAEFAAPSGLAPIGNMSWVATTQSGNPQISPDNGVGSISPGTLELSNVDLTEEMVNLLDAQHDFQANAQVEQTYNEIMQLITKI